MEKVTTKLINLGSNSKIDQSLIECVINISEGRNSKSLKTITNILSNYSNVCLLHVDIGKAANRSVLTIIGDKKSLFDAIFELFRVATHLIDMQNHQGIHPRIGAVDVCPFIPFINSNIEECIGLAHQLGEKIWKELNVPVYLYGKAAKNPSRISLANCRRGEYEGIPDRMSDDNNYPDFGDSTFNRQSGISVIGARDFLVAFNVNLDTPSPDIAKKIAAAIREKRVEKGSVQKGLSCVKAIGWYVEEYGFAQVSTNILNYEITSLFEVYDSIAKEAEGYGVKVNGSELIGMIPIGALVATEKLPSLDSSLRSALIQASVQRLGLDSISPFIANEKILEIKLMETPWYET